MRLLRAPSLEKTLRVRAREKKRRRCGVIPKPSSMLRINRECVQGALSARRRTRPGFCVLQLQEGHQDAARDDNAPLASPWDEATGIAFRALVRRYSVRKYHCWRRIAAGK